MMKIIAVLLVLMIMASCITDGKKTNTTPVTAVKEKLQKREATTELAERLYARFHYEPVTQKQIDENALIDYAVEKNLDVKRTATGLYYIIHQEGTGPNLMHGQPTKAHYQGYTLDGKIFDSSHKRGKPMGFSVGQMIAGWNEALTMMNTGTKAQLLIPSHLAYGERGFPGLIAPHTPLVFDLEIMPLIDKK